MPTNLIQPLQDKLDELTRQHGEAAAQYEALGKQARAAQQREADLQQQLKAVQTELAQLGLMQLGRRMMLRAELDNARKKLAANKQLQESLDGKQQTVRKQLSQLTAAVTQTRLELAEAALHAAKSEPIPANEAPAAPEAPAQAPPPVSEPAPVRQPAAPRKPRTQAAAPRRIEADLPLPEQIHQLLTELEPFYPEHQVFAPEVLSAGLRSRLIQLTERSGAESPAAFLQAQGWQLIGLQQAKALRQGKHCTPGEEPEVIRPKLNSVLHRLEKHYPDRIIRRSIQHDHKSLAQDVSGLYQWLGYPGAAAMLIAYGFHYAVPSGGRPATNIPVVIGALRAAYPADARPRTISQIMTEHPEHAGVLKTLQNQAPARFGMSLRQYLTQQGVLASGNPAD